MTQLPEQEFLRKLHWRQINWRRQPGVWLVAAGIGTVVGYVVILFRLLINSFSTIGFGGTEATLFERAKDLPAWQILLVPTLGGLMVGFVIHRYLGGKRASGVTDLIEARALHAGNINLKDGIMSALVAALSMGTGASTGREGPAAHLGGTLAAWVSKQLDYPPRIARILLGAGAAAAVAASFNAPIAGVMFALEVVLGFYSARAFAPIVIASVAGALIVRLHIGDMPAFVLPDFTIRSIFEIPAFALLGMLAALFAVFFMRVSLLANRIADHITLPIWIKPAIGGFLVGVIALAFPEVLGVGYGATDSALRGIYGFGFLLALILAKTLATSLSLGFRLGGGVFSPSLFLGAMIGAAFGIAVGAVLPGFSSEVSLYAIIGMGAVSAAILGAPISTTLIIFELTGDYGVMIALMVATSTATVLTQAMFGGSYFHMLLERRGHHIADGPQRLLLETIRVEEVMTGDTSGLGRDVSEEDFLLHPTDTIGRAFELFERMEDETILVVEWDSPKQPIGYVYHKRALQVFNKALIEANIEEHR
jgi:chloride channel protein, CIC family